jgi:hypothetical protein
MNNIKQLFAGEPHQEVKISVWVYVGATSLEAPEIETVQHLLCGSVLCLLLGAAQPSEHGTSLNINICKSKNSKTNLYSQ